MAVVLVEHLFDPPADPSAFSADTTKPPCLETLDVRWLGSFAARDGSQCVCVYDAADAEAVRRAYRQAEIPFRKVWPATHYHPPG